MNSYLVIIKVIIIGVLGYTNGIPLESPSRSLSSYFTPYIWGGEDVPIGFAPHKAALVIGAFGSLVCGGSIVSEKSIVTAAQCITPLIISGEMMPTYHAIVGSNKWRSDGYAVSFSGYHVHPEWDSLNVKNDLGVLHLAKKLVFSKFVSPIGLGYDWVGGDEKGFVTGFGVNNQWLIPDYLQVLNIKTLSGQKCVDTVHELIGNIAPHVDPKLEICTYQPIGEGMCMGDIGNGLISTKSNKLVGVASWGFACAFGIPDVFSRISAYKEFLQDKVK